MKWSYRWRLMHPKQVDGFSVPVVYNHFLLKGGWKLARLRNLMKLIKLARLLSEII